MADKPKTFFEFMNTNFTGDGTITFTTSDNSTPDTRMNRDYMDADYTLPEGSFHDVEGIGKAIKEYAATNNIDLKEFPEVKSAMSYDGNAAELSDAEMGSLVLASNLANHSQVNVYDNKQVQHELITEGSAELTDYSDDSDLTAQIGKEIYKDNTKGNLPGVSEGLKVAALTNNLLAMKPSN